MTGEPREPATHEPALESPRLAEAMEEYLAELETGVRPDRQRILARYPDIAAELASCLEGLDFVHCVAPQLKDVEGKPASARVHPLATLGDYRIVREIGRGGMAVVYEAEQLSLGRSVALKVLPFASMLDERQYKRFQNEARAAASLDHPHIVPIYGFGTDRGVHYYAMRLIDGQSLDHVLHYLQEPAQAGQAPRETAAWSSTHLSPDNAGFYRSVARIGLEAAEALALAHAQGILHRDIKPGNLLIDSQGVLWVADFGMARIEHDIGLTGSGDVVGTLRYMSPEQIAGKPMTVDPRSDIYSLGATLYELATLRPVFDARDRQQLLKQIGAEEAPAPQQLNKAVPTALSTIIHTCIQKDPAERYESAQDLADDLRRFLEDKPIHARPWTFLEGAASWLRRNRSLAWTTAAVMAVISCALAAATWRVSQERSEVVRQRDLLRQYLYAADMKTAAGAARGGHFGQMRAALDRHAPEAGEPDLRGFAWHYLNHGYERNQRTLRESAVLRGHTADVYFVAVSSDGTIIASASKDRTVRLWDAQSGQHLRTLRGHTSEVNSVSFAPDGQTIATASDDRSVRVWDVATGQQSWALDDFTRIVIRVQFSPEGSTLAATEAVLASLEVSTTLWDVRSRTLKQRWDDRLILAFSPDGSLIASSSPESIIRLHDCATGAERAAMWWHPGTVPAGAFSPDGKLLVTGSNASTTIVWDVETRREVARFDGKEEQLRTIGFSPDGGFLAIAGNDGLVRMWHLASRSLYHVFGAKQGTIWSVAFTPDGRHLITGGADGTVRRWPLVQATGHVCLPEHSYPISGMALSADGILLATADSESQAYLWSLPDAALARTISPASYDALAAVWSVGFAPRDQSLVLGDALGRIHVVEPHSAREVTTWQAHDRAVRALTFSEDGRFLATVDLQPNYIAHAIQLWNFNSRSLHRQIDHQTFLGSLSFSPDGNVLALASQAGVFRWDLSDETTSVVAHGSQNLVRACTFSPDGRWFATGSADRSIKLWDSDMQREQATLLGHMGEVFALAFSPDGKTLVSGSAIGEVKLWDLATGQELFDLPGHTGPVRHIAFSRDGQVLATAGDSRYPRGEVWLWFAPQPAAKEQK